MQRKSINLNNERMVYTSNEKKYDITIIEIKDEDNIENFLELDDIILDEILNDVNKNDAFIDKTMYIIQYPDGDLSVSYGILEGIYGDKNYDFKHKCSTKRGSSGSPILNAINNKIIGVHKKGAYNYNKGTFLNEPIKEFIAKYNDNSNEELLKEFNKKYNLNIENTKITKLELEMFNIEKLGNEGLKDLCQIEFKFLKKLELIDCDITDINVLENAKFDKLEILDLSGERNYFSDINILKKVNFKELKELLFNFKNISDIRVLEHVIFDNLEILDIGWNNISDINV